MPPNANLAAQEEQVRLAVLAFLDRYESNALLFVREVFGVEPDPWQIIGLKAYDRRERRISVRSGHGVGKTAWLAWLIIHFQLCRLPQKTVATAATGPQLFDALAVEVKMWVGKLPAMLRELLEVKSERIELKASPAESFVSFRTSRADQPEALAGVHSDNVLLIGDEASGIPEQVFEAAIGSMSAHNAIMILAGNPIRSSGLFFHTHHKLRDQWFTIHVNAEDSPRVDKDLIEQVRLTYGERSNAYRVRVLGEFPLADDDTVIPFELLEASLKRDVRAIGVRPIWGLDCARFGQDASALAKRRGNVLMEPVQSWHGLDTMELVGRVKALWDTTQPSERPEEICVDAIGLGAGVADRLRELGLPSRAINVSEAPALKGHHLNLRAELWFKTRDWFVARDCNLAGDDALAAQLVMPRFTYTSSGKIQVESKDAMKKRGERSPDKGDAFVLTFASESVTASGAESPTARGALLRVIKGLV